MDDFMLELLLDEIKRQLMDENRRLRYENVNLKARLYDLEHPATQSGIDWSVFDMATKGGEKSNGDNELVDGFGASRRD